MTTLALALLLAAANAPPTAPVAGDRVRIVEAPGGRPFTARVTDVLPGALVVRTDDRAAPRRLELSGVSRLEVSRGRHGHFGKGARVGLLIGAALGAALLAVTHEDEPPTDCTCDMFAPGFVAGALVVTGAVYGGLAGMAFRSDRWEAVPLPPGGTARVGPVLAAVPGGVRAGLSLRF